MNQHDMATRVPANRVPDYMPPGPKPHIVTIYRWMSKGVRGVKLKTMYVGGIRYTTPLWIADFLVELNASDGDEHIAAQLPTAPHRERQIARANRELATAGW